jgi:hypothetical protein
MVNQLCRDPVVTARNVGSNRFSKEGTRGVRVRSRPTASIRDLLARCAPPAGQILAIADKRVELAVTENVKVRRPWRLC